MFTIKNYEQHVQQNETNPTLLNTAWLSIRPVFFLAFLALSLAVSQLSHMLSVHFRLPDDIAVKLILAGIEFYIT